MSLGYLFWNSVRIYQEYAQSVDSTTQTAKATDDQPLQGVTVAQAATAKTNQINTLQVASMRVDSRIWEGATTATLSNGLWRIPGSSTPDKGGNTVIAAHRWK
jgi:sortase (surface protein transpeptidase)